MRLSRLAVLLPALFAAQLSLAQPSTNAPTTTVDNRTIISLAADAYREVQQDRVILSLSKEMRGPEAKVLADEVNKAINAVLEAGKGNDKLNLKTGSYNLWSQQEYDDSGKPTGKAIYVVTG
ncbi:MAG: SIMPL domain-containing protein, partial [Alcaligenaceae bacterium]|nr:SIMPL domain-containing protein [Alcaligenaceae bacterium]